MVRHTHRANVSLHWSQGVTETKKFQGRCAVQLLELSNIGQVACVCVFLLLMHVWRCCKQIEHSHEDIGGNDWFVEANNGWLYVLIYNADLIFLQSYWQARSRLWLRCGNNLNVSIFFRHPAFEHKYIILYLCRRLIYFSHQTAFNIWVLSSKGVCHFHLFIWQSSESTESWGLAQENDIYEEPPFAYHFANRFPHKHLLKGTSEWYLTEEHVLRLLPRLPAFPVYQSALCAHAWGPHAEYHLLEKGRSPHSLREDDWWA